MPERFALIIANSQFNDPKLARLIAPNKDAEILKRVLEDPKIGGFNVTLLLDEPYTKIRREIVRLFEGRTRSDSLLLYYSGHGIKDDAGDLYLATRETQTDLISAASIEADFVRARLDKSNSQRKIILLDCCHSGAFMQGAKTAMGSSVDTQAAFGGSGYGWGILTASNAIEYAWEDSTLPVEARTSIFTHFLVQGLESGAADLNRNGEVSLQELYDYIHEQVLTSGHTKQTPLMWQKAEGQIIIAQNPHPVGDKGVALPGELQQAIDSSLAWMRAGAVTELEMLLRSSNAGLARTAREALEKLREDDSLRVSKAAAAALELDTPSPSPVPPTPAPERHPSLGGDLRPSPATVDVGQETTWTFALHNDGDTDLFAINARHGTTLLVKPFDLKTGDTKRLTFTTSYPTSGRKTEEVGASTTSDGITVEHTATARVTVRQPKPTLHPSLKLTLSADPQVVDTGVEVRWSIVLRNSGDDNLRKVVVYFDNQPKCEPFDLLVGREKRFTLGRTYNTAGDKSEGVTATGIASDGSSVRDEIQATVTVRQPAPPTVSPAPVDNAIREEVKAFARSHDPESIINCPVCNCQVTAKNLVRHFDKVHAEDRSITIEKVRQKIKAATSKPSPIRAAPAQTTTQPTPSQGPSLVKLAPSGVKTRQQFQTLMQKYQPEELITCPLCNATLHAKDLVWHFDRRHAQNVPESTTKPAQESVVLPLLGSILYVQNITTPIFLKLLPVPAGEFIMGSNPAKDANAQSNEQPQHRVNVPEFYISEYPITNVQYETFIKATNRDAPEHWKRLLLKPKIPANAENQAIIGVSWHDAVAFCQWLGKSTGKRFRLPTEAEWEKAARGAGDRISSWQPQRTSGSFLSSQLTNLNKSDSPYGCMDMGLHLEWTQSLYWKYPYQATDGRENLTTAGKRAVRGSGLLIILDRSRRHVARQGYDPSTRVQSVGNTITFRVVLIPA